DAKNKNIEIMGNTLYRAYLKDFFKFWQRAYRLLFHNFRLNWASLVSFEIPLSLPRLQVAF
ncbi:hypothetical protein MKW92_043015, partial [Papaver armeniacum]